MNHADRAKLFATICMLYLSNGCEERRTKEQLKLITGDVILLNRRNA